MSERDIAAREYFTPELLEKLGRWEAEACVYKTPEAIAVSLRQHGIGIVDLARTRHLIDERVYESALMRARAAEEKAVEPVPESVKAIINGLQVAKMWSDPDWVAYEAVEKAIAAASKLGLLDPAGGLAQSCASGSVRALTHVNALPPAGDADVA